MMILLTGKNLVYFSIANNHLDVPEKMRRSAKHVKALQRMSNWLRQNGRND